MTIFVDRKRNKWTKTALKDTKQKVFWSDSNTQPPPSKPLSVAAVADIVIIGAGYTGLWTALQAKEDTPEKKIIVLEANVAGFGASSRNGGFCESSLTHGLHNGIARWEDELNTLNRLGRENLKGILDSIKKYNIDADVEETGTLYTANAEWQVEELKESVEDYTKYGIKATFLNKTEIQKELKSETNLAGLRVENETIMVNPAKLVWGLKRACLNLGVKFYEHTEVLDVIEENNNLIIKTPKGSVTAPQVISATNAWVKPIKKIRNHIITIFDHVLMTEPLSDAQLASIGWEGRQGVGDCANQFHYYRLSADNRILWGGWDANYYKNSEMGPDKEKRETSFELLSDHFFEAFPQLEGQLKFTHKWAGPIGTTSQFSATFGTKFNGKLVWVGGYTGLGVGASRFGARVALDLLENIDNERTQLKMVQKKPMPFPPEPLRHFFIQYTKKKIAQSDANDGKRGIWLGILDSLGLGFDS
ncbi:NAD(P)/FAD-dependent oxidoreductase [Maribacter sp. Asnod1-A12]|uniref:NAD(P)/FAD-dependent oxidoreductase n=1 Tax=Maribacter sp. Asnod1-A12 TaxID=3160576 RepID=UPI003870EA99